MGLSMDGVKRPPALVRQDAAPPRFLPPESPLPMPQQALRGAKSPGAQVRCAGAGEPAASSSPPALLPLRRAVIFGATIAMTAAAGFQMYLVLEVGGLPGLEGGVLGPVILLFACAR